MKKTYYSSNPLGTIKISLTGCKEWPKLKAQLEQASAPAEVKHTRASAVETKRQNVLEPGDLPVAIECLLYYQQYYNLN